MVASFDPEQILAALDRHGVDYILIGGMAVQAHGYVRATEDVDFVAEASNDNLRRLAAALAELNARLHGVDAQHLPVDPTDPDDLEARGNFTMVTDAGRLDFFQQVPGGADYHDLRRRALTVDLGAVQVQIVGLDDLVRMKRAAGRPRDLQDLAALTTQLDLPLSDPHPDDPSLGL